MAKLGATVLLLNRESERSASSHQQLPGEAPNGSFYQFTCDLQDFSRVLKAIEEITARYDQLDVLCNNAGVMALPDINIPTNTDLNQQSTA